MTTVLSKRQQARNEKVLQELVQTVPGNNLCADCQARNPAWASWSLGIFLCMRCAAIHRKLGTHVSKVKSLSMDSWSNEQVENMRKVGNVSSNKTYNPQNKKVQLPVDADEIDGAMERYIRQKYMNRSFNTGKRHNTGSTESDETPPPLPPKSSRFGFRSASSIFPLGSKAKAAQQPPPSPRDLPPDPSPRWNKASQVFGASVGGGDDGADAQATETKLAKLRDMGFLDEQRNLLVLKGVSGNMEKTIEALVRLGEGAGPSPGLVPPRQSSMPVDRTLTHAASATSMRDTARTRPLSPATNNPFHMLDNPPTPQPLSSQSTGTLQNRNPYLAPSHNPFGVPSQQVADLTHAYQGFSLAPPSQPLFPNHTGGVAAQQAAPQVTYQQPLTPQAPTAPQNYLNPYQSSLTYPLPTQPTGYNPFMTQPPQQQQQQQPLSVNTAGSLGGGFGSNPFTRSPTRMQSPQQLTQIPEQSQQNFYAAQQPQVQVAQTTNPFFAQAPTMPQQYQQQPAQLMQQQSVPTMPQQQPSPFAPQMTGYYQQQQPVAYQPPRPDKASILALYNYPQMAPAQFQGAQSGDQAQAEQQQPPQQAQMPTGSKNPFMGGGNSATPFQNQNLVDSAFAPAAAKPYNSSRESVMAGGFEWTNGRHSPDAFASLSANTR